MDDLSISSSLARRLERTVADADSNSLIIIIIQLVISKSISAHLIDILETNMNRQALDLPSGANLDLIRVSSFSGPCQSTAACDSLRGGVFEWGGRECVVSRINDRQLRTASFPSCLPAVVRPSGSSPSVCPSIRLVPPPPTSLSPHRFLAFRSCLFSLFP